MREHDEARHVRALLAEDAASPEEASALLETMLRLRRLPAPAVDPRHKALLARRLVAELNASTAGRAGRVPRPGRLRAGWPLLLLRAQMRVVQGEIWAASALVMALGLLVTLALDHLAAVGALPFVLIAPVVAAVSVAFLYDSGNAPLHELERGTPAPPRLLWLARLTLVFGFDFMLGLASSVALWLLGAQAALWPLVLSWLAPMAFLSALAFLLSALRGDPLAGTLASLALWAYQAVGRLLPRGLDLFAVLPDLLSAGAQLWLWLSAAALAAAGLWLVGREGCLADTPSPSSVEL